MSNNDMKSPFKVNSKTWTPTFEGVLMQKLPKTTSRGGLVMPEGLRDEAQDESPIYLVLAVGKDVKLIKPGMVVTCSNAPRLLLRYGGQDFSLCIEAHVAAILDDPPDWVALAWNKSQNLCDILDESP